MNGRPFLFERCFQNGSVAGLKDIPQGLKPRLLSEANVRAEARTLQKPVPSKSQYPPKAAPSIECFTKL